MPLNALGSVLENDALGFQLVPDGIGRGKVLFGTGAVALLDFVLDLNVDVFLLPVVDETENTGQLVKLL